MLSQKPSKMVLNYFLLLFLGSIFLMVRLLWPFLSILILSFLLAGIFQPIYQFLRRYFSDSMASLTTCLLLSAGIVTTLPLIWFISATKKLNYSIVGMIQYIAPTLMCLLGYWIYKEAFPPGRLITFSLVWFGLLLVVAESVSHMRNRKY